MNKLEEYLDARHQRICRVIDGLLHSKKKCEGSKNWTEQDDKDLLIAKTRQKEVMRISSLMKQTGEAKDIQFYIDREKEDFKRMQERTRKEQNDEE